MQGIARLIGLFAAAFAAAASAQTTQSYIYDVHGRLVAASNGQTNTGSATTYVLDAADNRSNRGRVLTTARSGGQQRLSSGETLVSSQQLQSTDGRFIFLFQPADGNAVIYWIGVAPLWSTNTTGGTSLTLAMEPGGDLVMKDYLGSTTFQTGTGGNPGAYLVMQNDGNLVLYSSGGSVLWNSGTCCH